MRRRSPDQKDMKALLALLFLQQLGFCTLASSRSRRRALRAASSSNQSRWFHGRAIPHRSAFAIHAPHQPISEFAARHADAHLRGDLSVRQSLSSSGMPAAHGSFGEFTIPQGTSLSARPGPHGFAWQNRVVAAVSPVAVTRARCSAHHPPGSEQSPT